MGGIVRLVFGGSSYTPPPAPAPAPKPAMLPTVVDKAVTDVKTQAMVKLGKKGRYGTLLTGRGDSLGSPDINKKSLLGG